MADITELRIVLPMTVEEFRRAQKFANCRTNEHNTVEGQGGQLLSSMPYEDEVWGVGTYSHSLYRLGDRLPDWVTRLVPSNALVIDEKTWMTYPFSRTVITIPFFRKLKIEMLSMHVDDNGSTDNILGLSEADLAIRQVDMVDIANDQVLKRDYRAELDPKLYKSEKTGRGPLVKDWRVTVEPVMCAYRLVKVEANYWGFQKRAQKLMLNGIRQIVLLTHRNAFCWLDEWFDLTFDEICAREVEGRQKLRATVKHPPLIDAKNGKEPVNEDSSSSDDSGTSDIEMEFFEAEMEWAIQDVDQFGVCQSSGLDTLQLACPPPPSDIPSRCAVCAARGKALQSPVLLCKTCNEFFCQLCFSEFHVTPRLKDHASQSIRTCLDSTNSIDPASLAPSLGELRGLAKTRSDTAELDRPPLSENGQDRKILPKQVDGSVRDVGDPLKEGRRSVRRASKLRRSQSSYGALNAFLESGFEDNHVQEPQESASLEYASLGANSNSPNELSEELVRTLSSLYEWCSESYSSTSLSRGVSQELGSPYPKIESISSWMNLENRGEEGALDPYGIREENSSWEIGLYARSLEVVVVPTAEKLNKHSTLHQHLRALVKGLRHVEPKQMNHEQCLAFWINIYNSLLLHAYLVYGVPKGHYKRIAFMNKVTYIIGGCQYTPLAIEHSILRANSYRPTLASLLPIRKYKKSDERFSCALDQAEPLISFALCCGSRSSPVVRTYTGTNIRAELQAACQDFIMAAVGVSQKKHVLIPKILHWYAPDFSHDAKSLVEWVAEQLPEDKRAALDECVKKKPGKWSQHRMSVVPYDWSFRYLFDHR